MKNRRALVSRFRLAGAQIEQQHMAAARRKSSVREKIEQIAQLRKAADAKESLMDSLEKEKQKHDEDRVLNGQALAKLEAQLRSVKGSSEEKDAELQKLASSSSATKARLEEELK